MSELDAYLRGASLGLILFGLLLSQLGLPLPETVFVIAAGVVCERAGLSVLVPIWSTCLAVMAGDALLYGLARAIGLEVLQRRPLCWFIPGRARPRVDELFERHGAMTIFVARFITGIRLVAFALAGMRKMPLLRFMLWDGLAILVTVPIFAALGFAFAASSARLNQHVTEANLLIITVLVLCVAGYASVVAWRRRGNRAASARED